MRSGTLWRVLGLCLLAVGAWSEDEEIVYKNDNDDAEYKVSISGTKVQLTCPGVTENDKVKWKTANPTRSVSEEPVLTMESFSEMEDSGYYSCEVLGKSSLSLYLKARVCDNCLEVDLLTVVTIIIVDICVTLGLLLGVYYWSRNRKAKGKPVTRAAAAGGRPRGQNKERPPPVPNPDYEPIRKGQRDLYSGLNHRGV